MDRDHARAFIRKMVDEEREFIASLESHRDTLESAEDWKSTMKNFAPDIKSFYNTRLEAWSRFYLGLDAQSYNQGHGVMHLAQKKERNSMAPTIPHSVFGELKYKMKVGTAHKLTASGAAAAREIMERKLGGEAEVIEAKGKGGKIGGIEQQLFEGEEVVQGAGGGAAKAGGGPANPETKAPAPKSKEGGPPKPKKGVHSGEGDVAPDEQLAAILQRRKQMYAQEN